ncbi:MAG TPA: nucleotidyltransferase domain-containing protein [Planctomycetota bacterium]|nr:nucleotidyltransferase domain-containing protein [Planctomycetota bacterium]
MDRDQVIALLRRYFAGRQDLVAAYLFGSVARGEARATSDIDVGILLRKGKPRELADFDPVFAIQADLEREFRRKVDVVSMNGAPADLLHRILRDGIVVHDQDHRRRVEFELRTRTEYFDLLPLLQRYRRTVLRPR